MSPDRCRVLIVDDHPVLRRGLVDVLAVDAAIEVVGMADDVDEALDFLASEAVDVALVDIGISGGTGFELVRRIRVNRSDVKCIIYSAHPEYVCAGWAVRAGAVGYVEKTAEPSTLRQAILEVWRGKLAFSSLAIEREFRRLASENDKGFTALTDREFEALLLVGLGYNSHDVAARLGCALSTADSHQNSLRGKLQVPYRDALIRLATLVFADGTGNAVGMQDDERLIDDFVGARIPEEQWTHRTHLRVGFHYVNRFPFGKAVSALRRGIQRLNARHGKPRAYHETITLAWARLLGHTLARDPLWLHSEAFLRCHPELLGPPALGPLLAYYSEPRLLDPLARAEFVEPDLAELPAPPEWAPPARSGAA